MWPVTVIQDGVSSKAEEDCLDDIYMINMIYDKYDIFLYGIQVWRLIKLAGNYEKGEPW